MTLIFLDGGESAMIAEFKFSPSALIIKQAIRLVLVLGLSVFFSYSYAENAESPPPVVSKAGFDSAGNWVDVNWITWSKITKGDYSYLNAKNFCKNKDTATDSLQWQLPTAKQAGSFYKQTIRPKRLGNSAWELGPVWTMTGGVARNYQVVDMRKGTVSWGGVSDFDNEGKYVFCVSLPQGFDDAGNYFDGKLMWSKITNKGYSKAEAIDFCEKMDKDVKWKLPAYDQLYMLADTLIVRTALKDVLTKRGWTLGMTYSQGNSISLGETVKPGNKAFVTCVKRGM